MNGGTWVNPGLERWTHARQVWLQPRAQPNQPRRTAKNIDLDEVIESIFTPEAQGRLPCAVSLPQMIDLMVDLWEADGLFD